MERDALRSNPRVSGVLQALLAALDDLPDQPQLAASVREILLGAAGDEKTLTAAVTDLSRALGAVLRGVDRAKDELDRIAA